MLQSSLQRKLQSTLQNTLQSNFVQSLPALVTFSLLLGISFITVCGALEGTSTFLPKKFLVRQSFLAFCKAAAVNNQESEFMFCLQWLLQHCPHTFENCFQVLFGAIYLFGYTRYEFSNFYFVRAGIATYTFAHDKTASHRA